MTCALERPVELILRETHPRDQIALAHPALFYQVGNHGVQWRRREGTLALFGRQDLATDWARSGSAAFLETMIAALPDAITAEIGEIRDRIDPRWGTQAARFVAQRIAHHIQDLIKREERLGEFNPL